MSVLELLMIGVAGGMVGGGIVLLALIVIQVRTGKPVRMPVPKRFDPRHKTATEELIAVAREIGLPASKNVEVGENPSRVYVGKCACGCGEDVYYNGFGRKPRFVNQDHKYYYHGRKVSPF